MSEIISLSERRAMARRAAERAQWEADRRRRDREQSERLDRILYGDDDDGGRAA